MHKLITAAIAAAIAITGIATDAANRPRAATIDYLNVMPLGDSITRGHGDPAWNGYRYDLQQRLAGVGLNPNFVGPWTDGTMGDNNHAGISGARIDQISVAIPQLIADYQPEVVLLMLGTNDIGQRYELDTAVSRLQALIYRIRPPGNPGAIRVFVASVPQFRDASNDPYVDAYNNAVHAMVDALGSSYVSYVPQEIVGDDPDLELYDNVHPNACGYARISWVWYYYLGRSPLNTSGGTWPSGYYPFGTAPGPCAPASAPGAKKWWPTR
jgi:lysophospholipase L1-like esterase